MLAPLTVTARAEEISVETGARGQAVLSSPMLNKGAAFTEQERKSLGLTGLLPPYVSTLEAQVRLAYKQYESLPDVLARNVYLTALHDRNEVLFYRLLSDHLREMIPILDDLPIRMAMDQYRQECRRPRGVYLSIDHAGEMEEAFGNLPAGAGDIDLIIATDAEQIPGVGDWGAGAIEVAIGKLAIYTAAGGIHPARVLPVMLDVGTDRESALADPTYVGNRHSRVRGERYDAFIDEYVRVATTRFPNALLQWEDFAPANGRRLIEKYRDRICTFNDDMQGTGAITLAAAISAIRVCGTPLRNQRIVVFGAGTAGVGIADRMVAEMVREGLSAAQAARRFWFVDRQGLLTLDMAAELQDHQAAYARPTAESSGWPRDEGGIGLAEVVRRVKPTMLIGTSGASDSFTEPIVKEMAANTPRPIIFALSNPPARAEASAADLIVWTGGRGLIATGCPSMPVTYKGVTYVVAQINNAMLYPGLVLGTVVSGASRISEGMFAAAACAVSSLVIVRQPGASLLPHIDDLRSVSMTVAAAVAEAAAAEGLARGALTDTVQQVQDAMWRPEYPRIQAS